MDTNSSSSASPPSNILTATDSPGNQPQSQPPQSFGSSTFRRILLVLSVVGILGGGYVWYVSPPEPVTQTPQAAAPSNRNNAQPAATPVPSNPTPTGTTTPSSN